MSKPPLNYPSPDPQRTPASVADAVAGVFSALVAGPGVVVLATMIAEYSSDDDYAALGGLFVGAAAGGLLTLILLAIGIRKSRSSDGRRRGFGMGLMIGTGMSLLGVGICFAVIS
jgi:hypothetical protein